jgi:hypothetical protein
LEASLFRKIIELILGSSDLLELEHRCYNGVCLTAAVGCMLASVISSLYGVPIQASLTTLVVGGIYLYLYYASRRIDTYQPLLWVYISIGVVLLIMTWLYNGGINGSGNFISMVALVAMMVVLKSHRFLVVILVFFPTMSILFLLEYVYPDIVSTYYSRGQRFLDLYLTFVVSTAVIVSIVTLILQSYCDEKGRLDRANNLLKEKMEILNRTNRDLEVALEKVETLSGLLPICASCKKIRDDKGYWNQIESFIEKYSDAEFSHSICPECSKKLYPDLKIGKYDVLRKNFKKEKE